MGCRPCKGTGRNCEFSLLQITCWCLSTFHSHDSGHVEHKTGYYRPEGSDKAQEEQIFQVVQGEGDQVFQGEKEQEQQRVGPRCRRLRQRGGGQQHRNNNNTDTNNEDNNENTQSAITTECSDVVLAIAPVTYCNDWIPGIGRKECDNDNSASRGGEVCNIVSMAWLRALKQDNVHVDLVLNHAGLCHDVIEQGPVTESDILNVLPEGFGIAIVHMTGSDIKKALQQGAKAAYDGDPKAYPYGYGIRYSIDYANRSVDEGFVYNIQVKPNGVGGSEAWVEIDDLQTYFVATNSMLASGEGGYDVFLDVPGVDKDILIMYSDADLFIKYAKQKCELDAAPYSTYSFAGLNALLSGAYSCLEDRGLCECGFC